MVVCGSVMIEITLPEAWKELRSQAWGRLPVPKPGAGEGTSWCPFNNFQMLTHKSLISVNVWSHFPWVSVISTMSSQYLVTIYNQAGAQVDGREGLWQHPSSFLAPKSSGNRPKGTSEPPQASRTVAFGHRTGLPLSPWALAASI